MLKNLSALIVLLHFTSLLFAQENVVTKKTQVIKGFYVHGGLGYAFPQAGETFGLWEGVYSGTSTNPASANNYSYNVNKVSFSSGLRGCLGLGYTINKNVAIELSGDMGIINTKYTYTGINSSAGAIANGATDNITVTQNAHLPLILSPSLVLQTGGNIWNIYTRLGVAMPLSHKIDIEEDHDYTAGGVSDLYTFTQSMQTSFSLGFNGALGLSYKLSDNLALWGEMSVLSLALYAKEDDLQAATLNGANNFNNVNRPVILFSANGSASNNQETTYAIPFSNVAFNFGLKWNLPEIARKKKHITPRQFHKKHNNGIS
jgi:hypothetical protein